MQAFARSILKRCPRFARHITLMYFTFFPLSGKNMKWPAKQGGLWGARPPKDCGFFTGAKKPRRPTLCKTGKEKEKRGKILFPPDNGRRARGSNTPPNLLV